jgi:hypothetical protein
MAMPATTGTLKTRVQDMEIGDYIVCNYLAASGAAGTFSNLGGAAGTEIPVAGSATPNGTFYWIKSARGLLIADRCVQHTRTWDSINTSKCIQGMPWDAGNIIPTMTSNTSPSGVASAGSSISESRDAWQAFNKSTSSWWSSNALATSGSEYLSYEFVSPTKIYSYAISSRNDGYLTTAPKTWTFEGYDETTQLWRTLDSQVNITGWSAGQKRLFLLSTPATFKKYRVNVTFNNGDATLCIAELEMMDTIGIIRSLTGGVAYADANGNTSLSNTDSISFGNFPSTNEYDKYIINFPQKLIEPGKTLNDIFHNDTCFVWTQDTPITSIGSSSNRVVRGHAYPKFSSDFPSNITSIDLGFRPVFEFRE